MKNLLEHLRAMSVHTHQLISFVSMIAGAIVGWISCQVSADVNVVMILSFIAMIGGILWHLIFVRCPYCGHHFNLRAGISNFCPNCGGNLE